jgi:hypothetical protein
MNATAELESMARRIKREMYEPYVFAEEWEWTGTLRELELKHKGRTSLLWRRFLAFDAARKAHEAAAVQRHRWQRHLVQLRRQIHQAEHEQDPDTIDYAAYGQAKLKAQVLEARLVDPHGVVAERKAALQRAEDSLGKLWQAYTLLKATERQLAQSEAPGAFQELLSIRTQIEHYEAPRGDQA